MHTAVLPLRPTQTSAHSTAAVRYLWSFHTLHHFSIQVSKSVQGKWTPTEPEQPYPSLSNVSDLKFYLYTTSPPISLARVNVPLSLCMHLLATKHTRMEFNLHTVFMLSGFQGKWDNLRSLQFHACIQFSIGGPNETWTITLNVLVPCCAHWNIQSWICRSNEMDLYALLHNSFIYCLFQYFLPVTQKIIAINVAHLVLWTHPLSLYAARIAYSWYPCSHWERNDRKF